MGGPMIRTDHGEGVYVNTPDGDVFLTADEMAFLARAKMRAKYANIPGSAEVAAVTMGAKYTDEILAEFSRAEDGEIANIHTDYEEIAFEESEAEDPTAPTCEECGEKAEWSESPPNTSLKPGYICRNCERRVDG